MDRYESGKEVDVYHSPEYGAAFSNWLKQQLHGLRRNPERSVGIDVGAYQGEFMAPLVEARLVSEAFLFEPNPGNAAGLRDTFPDNRFTIEEAAVGSSGGSGVFQFGDDGATGSLLEPTGATPPAPYQRNIPLLTLDDYARSKGLLDRVNLLKIDAQGSDLDVLHGAAGLLESSKPVVVAELLFASLYLKQTSAYQLIAWMNSMDYHLVGLFDEHFSSQGWLAWADGCFLPISRMNEHKGPFQIRRSLTSGVADSHAPSSRSDKPGGLRGKIRRIMTRRR